MTEFRRMLAAVEDVEVLVKKLAARATSNVSDADFIGFLFDPPPRQVPSATGDDWIVVGSRSAFEGQVSEEQRGLFEEAELRFNELAPLAAKMRRRHQAREELEVVKAQLQQWLPRESILNSTEKDSDGTLITAEEGTLVAIQSSKDTTNRSPDLQRLLDRAHELDGLAIYGAKTSENVADLLARYEAARALFDTDVVPRLAAAVAAAAADEAERRVEAETEAATEQARRNREEALRPVIDLLAASEARIRLRQQEAEALQNRHQPELAQTCAAAARATVPSCSFSMFS
mmetsp:Transcript_119197/g.237642  ORF Transcript_119197/g.237642 Transcript_119197/m.237642 type:complete len:289 (-) Transcript_119197:53-919(-)|eukprot:CAMPEP_0172694786 /NCGR_PEP_ID=MMETSP1074-20121228/26906_1 /TAXON_ID=2916 /ORGANISM="Ceratium fusus, Strain PA161109" /LENGTH=288 /DNA_ID=CAMNT_0013515317 /DNA_START=21 /DNA_END=887 /DNA_ORIENTATION=-